MAATGALNVTAGVAIGAAASSPPAQPVVSTMTVTKEASVPRIDSGMILRNSGRVRS